MSNATSRYNPRGYGSRLPRHDIRDSSSDQIGYRKELCVCEILAATGRAWMPQTKVPDSDLWSGR